MKRFYLTISLLLAIVLGGCSDQPNVLATAISQIDDSTHIEQLHDYDSPYTICYKNKNDTYSMYIFASPIQYKIDTGYEIIDNTVIESSDPNYAYENKANSIKTYFPSSLSNSFKVVSEGDFLEFLVQEDVTDFSEAKQEMFTNMYGDIVSAVIYERKNIDMVFYPTKAGIKSEIVIKEKSANKSFIYSVKSNGKSYENKQNGYILFKNSEINAGLIYQPLVKYKIKGEENIDISTKMEIIEKGDGYVLEIILNPDIMKGGETIYPIKFDPSFELYQNKMPDTSVYSKFDTNSYLRHYAIIGEHPTMGEGWEYLRFRLNWFMALDSTKITNAKFYIRNLSNSKSKNILQLFEMDEDWSSIKMLWSTRKTNFEDYIEKDILNNKLVEFDITNFVKSSFADKTWQEESNGLLFKLKNKSSFAILSTSDNSLYPHYIKFQTKVLPTVFAPRESINPQS